MKSLSEITEAEIRELPAGWQLDLLVFESIWGNKATKSPIFYSCLSQHTGELLRRIGEVYLSYTLNRFEDGTCGLRVANIDVGGDNEAHACSRMVAILGKRGLEHENAK